MHDEPLFSPRRLVNAARLWLHFALQEDFSYPLWQYMRYYRRQEAAERDGSEFFCRSRPFRGKAK